MKRDPVPPRDNPLFVTALEKGIEVLRSFTTQRKTMTLREIAEVTGMSKSSVQRLVFSLETMGFVAKHEKTRRFHLTPHVMSIGFNYLAADSLVDVSNPFLADLCNRVGETVNLLEPTQYDMVYVARFASHRFIPMHMPIGSRIPMFCTASGRAYLSALPEDESTALLNAMPRVGHTPNTVTGLERLIATVAEARTLGYALNTEELFPGDMAIAIPVLGSQGRPIAAVNLITPPSRWTVQEVKRDLLSKLQECAHAITNAARAM